MLRFLHWDYKIKQQKKELAQLQQKLKEDTGLNQRFTQLGLTRKREFADYIAEAKQDSTKARRLEKVVNCLQAGHGLYEKPKSP